MKSNSGSGISPVLVFPQDENSEAIFVADTISDIKSSGGKYSDFAVLYRTNVQSRPVIDELIKRDIPFNIKDSLSNFFEHWICRDITCYLKLSVNNFDYKSLSQIINRPLRYIPKSIFNELVVAKELEQTISLRPESQVEGIVFNRQEEWLHEAIKGSDLRDYQIEKIKKLELDIKSIKYMPPSRATSYIRKSIDYNEYIRRYCSDMDIKPDDFFDILDEYEAASAQFDTIPSFLSHIQEVSKVLREGHERLEYKKDSVTLSTIHSAKGLEFESVFIIGLVEGILPHKKCLSTGEGIEEERRLFYVASTRARNYLYITSFKKHHDDSCETSRFLKELKHQSDHETDIKAFMPGTLVRHTVFGTGKIERVQNGMAEINFITAGKKFIDIRTCIKNKLIEFSQKLH